MHESVNLSAWRMHHVGITVADIERSIRFYRDVLGFTLVRRRTADAPYLAEQTGYAGVRLEVASFKSTPDSAQSLELVQYLTHADGAWKPATNIAGSAHLCFQIDDIDAAYKVLGARGARFKTPPVAITSGPNQGGFGVYIYDPDDFIIELFQPPLKQSCSNGEAPQQVANSKAD